MHTGGSRTPFAAKVVRHLHVGGDPRRVPPVFLAPGQCLVFQVRHGVTEEVVRECVVESINGRM